MPYFFPFVLITIKKNVYVSRPVFFIFTSPQGTGNFLTLNNNCSLWHRARTTYLRFKLKKQDYPHLNQPNPNFNIDLYTCDQILNMFDGHLSTIASV